MKFLRLMALLEGISLLALFFVAMPMKYFYGMPEAVKLAGPIHGYMFLAFNGVLFYFVFKGQISEQKAFKGLLASLVPFGTFVYKVQPIKTNQ
ncbi:MAG: hypothetical protein ISEC1_P1494 [Thiomicrorhabdus sp.]|nr:MAG: hypothetical protein ISEC1_P1494 [Thiomicrorhabdus sp.]